MLAIVFLCVIFTVMFCLCARVALYLSRPELVPVYGGRGGYSRKAWRVARSYAVFAMALLAMASFFGAVKSYVDLFNL